MQARRVGGDVGVEGDASFDLASEQAGEGESWRHVDCTRGLGVNEVWAAHLLLWLLGSTTEGAWGPVAAEKTIH